MHPGQEHAGGARRKWTWSVELLHGELEREGHRAFYTSMAGVIISRESLVTATGYLLEKVSELMPDYH